MIPLRQALNEYKQTNIDAGAAYADPHTLISMLFEGLQARLSVAKGAMERQDFSAKGESIGKAIDIINYLHACLDKERGGEISASLSALYDYLNGCLLRASAENTPERLDEVSSLIKEIAGAWGAIRLVANKLPHHEAALTEA